VSKARRFELWSDVAAAGGTRLAMLPRDQVVSAIRTEDVSGEDTLELTMARSAGTWSSVSERRVIRTLYEDGSATEHRIERKIPARTERGGQVGSVRARSILQDLDNVLMTRAEADGTTTVVYTLLSLTVDDLVDLIVELTPVQFVKGTVDNPTTVVDSFTFDIDTALSALQRLAEVAELELAISGDAETPYLIDLVEQIGSAATVPELRYAKNLLSVQRTSDAAQLANIVYAFGANEGGIRANMGQHLWEVASVSTVDADTLDVVLVDSDVVAEDDSLNDRGIRRIRSGVADVEYWIEDSTRSTKTLRVTDAVGGGAPAIIAGDHVRFLVNAPLPGTEFEGNLVPDGDIDTTGWSTAPLWSKIDEGDTPIITAGEFIETSSTSLTLETKDCEVSLTNPGLTVDDGSIHRLKIYVSKLLTQAAGSPGTSTAKLTMSLYEGATERASYQFTPSNAWAWINYDLTSDEIGTITAYTDLRIRLTALMKVDYSGDTIELFVAASHFKIANPNEDPAGEGLIFVEDTVSQTTWGEARARVEYDDVRDVSNLVANPALADWTANLPDSWNLVEDPAEPGSYSITGVAATLVQA
jgi:phage minor structural protein